MRRNFGMISFLEKGKYSGVDLSFGAGTTVALRSL
jgi:hypothetical protein